MKGDAVIVIGDTHCGSTVGLSPPVVQLDDGDEIRPNKTRRWLISAFEQFCNDVERETKGYNRILVLNGDIGEIDSKSRSWQTLSRNPAKIIEIAANAIDPLAQMCNDVFVLRGTEAHTGKSAYIEEAIGRDLVNSIPDPDAKTASWWHLRMNFNKVKFDIAHHFSMGRLPHTYANAAMKLAQQTMVEYYTWGEKPPDVVVRAHNHRYADSGQTFDTRAFCAPAWQMKTNYLHRVSWGRDKASTG